MDLRHTMMFRLLYKWFRECLYLARLALNVAIPYQRSHQRIDRLFLKFWHGVGAIALSLLLVFSLSAQSAHAENYNKMTLIESDFSNQVMTDTEFTDANLRNSDLSHSDFTGVSFFGANLQNVNFAGANLRYTTLDNARMVNVNLTDALLEGAFAFNTKFDGATIDGADFTDVLMSSRDQEKLCAIATGTNPATGRNTRDTLNCP
ncbi:MAG: pentapeptide repeat-containing protein [Elainellaceae cyanobacterium]